jgi:hypothetical protein
LDLDLVPESARPKASGSSDDAEFQGIENQQHDATIYLEPHHESGCKSQG